MLSDADIRSWHDNGYLLVEDVLSADEVLRLRSALDELVERSRDVTCSNETFVLGEDHCPASPQLRRVTSPELHHPAFEELRCHARILDAVEDLIGPDLRFDHGKLNIKAPFSTDAAIEWHQDWAFYPHTNDDVLAVGIYLEDCAEDNGPLLVIPGSHRGEVFDHNDGMRFLGAADPAAAGFDATRAVPVPGNAGSITIHHVRTLHASRPNTGSRQRLLMLNTYKAADAWPLMGVADVAEYHAMMVRGQTCWTPRMEALPVRIPADLGRVGLFTTQEPVRGRSFGEEPSFAPALQAG